MCEDLHRLILAYKSFKEHHGVFKSWLVHQTSTEFMLDMNLPNLEETQ